MTPIRFAAALLVALAWTAPAPAQDAPADKDKDAALEKLLEKIGGDKPRADAPKAEAPDDAADKPKADEPKAEEPKPAADKPKADESRGEAGDQALDDLLKKIGTRDEEPAPPPRRGPGEGPTPPNPPDQPGATDPLKREDQQLDEHLEEILGRKKKPKDRQQQAQQGGGGGGSKLEEAVDKMRKVERRLAKTDTGEETRKTQGEIVKDLDTMLKQLRQMQARSQGRRQRGVQQAGNQQGQQPGQEGTNPGGVGPMPPKKPTTTHAMVGDKDEWGHLPPELRTELDNVFKEVALPTREDLIRRYYMTVNRKGKEGSE